MVRIMKLKIILCYLCVALLLPYSIRGAHENEGIEQMNKMAEEGAKMNDIFRPSIGGLLHEGSVGFTYKGELLLPIPREVAMKFTEIDHQRDALEEYEIYTYLGALHDTNIELYGIPKVYFFGRSEEYMMMALTLLDSEFKERSNAGWRSGRLNKIDILIVCREFVRITKYIHSRSIIHGDLRCENILFRRDRAYIIGYSLGQKMYRKGSNGVKFELPANAKAERRQLAREDWKQFLFSICEVVGVRFAWFDEWAFKNLPDRQVESYFEYLKQDARTILKRIQEIGSDELKRVLVEFAKIIFEDKIQSQTAMHEQELFYDYMDQIIREEIENLNRSGGPVLVSWLYPDQRDAAFREMQTNSTPSISSIKNPFELDKIEFPKVNYLHFYKEETSADTPGTSRSKRERK